MHAYVSIPSKTEVATLFASAKIACDALRYCSNELHVFRKPRLSIVQNYKNPNSPTM